MPGAWLGTGTLGRASVRQEVKEPIQVQWDIVMAPGVGQWQGGKAKKEASTGMPASSKTPVRGGAEIWSHKSQTQRWRAFAHWIED